MTPDLFTRMVDGFWFALESYGPLADLVQVANRQRFNLFDSEAVKQGLLSGDLPQLTIVPAPGSGSVNAPGSGSSSHSETFSYDYVLGLLSDNLSTRLPGSVDPVKWACLRALQRFSPFLPGLREVVKITRWGPFGDQITDVPGIDQVAPGWKAIMRLQVTAVLGKGRLY
ncbi:MAG: hypothetical protein AAB368_17160 [bacterium]